LPTVAFISPKGGAGKTTASLLLALGLVDRGLRVAMIDSDPNKPLVAWANMPGKPDKLTVHAAPMEIDLKDALREAMGKRPDWIILDTEGSPRPGLAFTAVSPDLVITPLAASQLEADQALKAAEMVEMACKRTRRKIMHACLLTRLPAAVRSKALKRVVELLRAGGVAILPTALIEKEAFRSLFSVGGGFDGLERDGVYGVAVARANAANYVATVVDLLEGRIQLQTPQPASEA
jgi:chromosome partitioning protein